MGNRGTMGDKGDYGRQGRQGRQGIRVWEIRETMGHKRVYYCVSIQVFILLFVQKCKANATL